MDFDVSIDKLNESISALDGVSQGIQTVAGNVTAAAEGLYGAGWSGLSQGQFAENVTTWLTDVQALVNLIDSFSAVLQKQAGPLADLLAAGQGIRR